MSMDKRLQKEIQEMTSSPPEGTSASLVGDDIRHWEAYVEGPSGSPFEGGRFQLDIKFTDKYPHQPPSCKFKTKIYHPNISDDGNICVDILKSQWSPALRVSSVLLSILSLLTDPNPDDPLVPDVARIYKTNRAKYEKTAKEWTQKHAMTAAERSSKRARTSASASATTAPSSSSSAPAAVVIIDDDPVQRASTPAAVIDLRPECQYGDKCYRKNEQHLKEFSHPSKK